MSDPAKDFNACDDFIVLITCHILAASLEVLSMQSLDDIHVLSLLPPELPQNNMDANGFTVKASVKSHGWSSS